VGKSRRKIANDPQVREVIAAESHAVDFFTLLFRGFEETIADDHEGGEEFHLRRRRFPHSRFGYFLIVCNGREVEELLVDKISALDEGTEKITGRVRRRIVLAISLARRRVHGRIRIRLLGANPRPNYVELLGAMDGGEGEPVDLAECRDVFWANPDGKDVVGARDSMTLDHLGWHGAALRRRIWATSRRVTLEEANEFVHFFVVGPAGHFEFGERGGGGAACPWARTVCVARGWASRRHSGCCAHDEIPVAIAPLLMLADAAVAGTRGGRTGHLVFEGGVD